MARSDGRVFNRGLHLGLRLQCLGSCELGETVSTPAVRECRVLPLTTVALCLQAKPRKKRSSGPQMCSVCGLPGHNKATCQLARAEKKASEETEREPADAVSPGSNSAGADHSTEATDSPQR